MIDTFLYENKRYYLVGAGKSGIAAAKWLLAQGALVCLNEIKDLSSFAPESREEIQALAQAGATLDFGSAADPARWNAEYVITSPGVPLDLPGIRAAAEEGAPVTNEIELGWQASNAQIVAVTGSNGKTTVTSLIGEILEDAGFAPFVGGNIGTPFIHAAQAMGAADWAVLELSSFQLAGALSLKPKVAVFLNLTPDHTDWHKGFENYAAAKWRIAAWQGLGDKLILNYDDPLLRAEGEERIRAGKAFLDGYGASGDLAPGTAGGPAVMWFSRKEKPASGVYVEDDGWVTWRRDGAIGARDMRNRMNGGRKIMPIEEFPLPGNHNLENLLAAIGAGLALGIEPETLRRSAGAFKAIEHRMEPAGEYGGVLYVNDSKATNPDSVIKALDAYERPVILIAGGDGKGAPFAELAKKIEEKVKLTVLIGRDGGIIKEALDAQGYRQTLSAEGFLEAIALCRDHAAPGDVVLLSPACASYDMFHNYEERGREFKRIVGEICTRAGS
ncbi:MAG: UDP-N-acetylmuramoyl-L-alanine--D-glutamate ligase [Clostridiales bacterium]|nr:UDP-N-acetylmuramoyl-L-alanine--D-glutamate ligase [Clostridiales bacterium]